MTAKGMTSTQSIILVLLAALTAAFEPSWNAAAFHLAGLVLALGALYGERLGCRRGWIAAAFSFSVFWALGDSPSPGGYVEAWPDYFRWVALPIAWLAYESVAERRRQTLEQAISWFGLFLVGGLTLAKLDLELPLTRMLFSNTNQTGMGSLWSWLGQGRGTQAFVALEPLSSVEFLGFLPSVFLGSDYRVWLALVHFLSGAGIFFLLGRAASPPVRKLSIAIWWAFPFFVRGLETGSPSILVAALAVWALLLAERGWATLSDLLLGAMATANPVAVAFAILKFVETPSRPRLGAMLSGGALVFCFGVHAPAFREITSEPGVFFPALVAILGAAVYRRGLASGRAWITAAAGAMIFGLSEAMPLLVVGLVSLLGEGSDQRDRRSEPSTWLLFGITRVLLLSGVFSFVSDLGYFHGLLQRTVTGDLPYRDFSFGYPPLAWLMIALPKLAVGLFGATSLSAYSAAFRLEIFAVDLWLFSFVRKWARGSGQSSAAWLYVALTTLLGSVLFDRLDLAVGALLLASVVGSRGQAFREKQWLQIAFGTLLKWAPVLLLPLERARSFGNRYAGRTRPRALMAVAGVALFGVTVAAVILFPKTGSTLLAPLENQLRRGIQVDSFWGALASLWVWILPDFAGGMRVEYQYGSHQWIGGFASLLKILSVILTSAALVGWTVLQAWGRKRDIGWYTAAAGAFLLLLVFGWVGSPQLLLWVMPLVIAASSELEPRDRTRFLSSFALSAFLASVGLCFYGSERVFLVVLLKNLALLAATFMLLRAALFGRAEGPKEGEDRRGLQ